MVDAFTLSDSQALDDLATYLGRAARTEGGSVRLIAGDGVLAVYVAVLYPAGLLDQSPTVLGLRTFALAERETFDVVVPVASLLARIERVRSEDAASVSLPMQVNTVTWAAISPPRGGWTALEPLPTTVLVRVAKAGIEEVAATVPAAGTGEQIVHRVRSEVWGRPIRSAPHLPAGAGFAALSLGFVVDDVIVDATTGDATTGDASSGEVEAAGIFESGPWTRISTRRGHVLVKRKAWSR